MFLTESFLIIFDLIKSITEQERTDIIEELISILIFKLRSFIDIFKSYHKNIHFMTKEKEKYF